MDTIGEPLEISRDQNSKEHRQRTLEQRENQLAHTVKYLSYTEKYHGLARIRPRTEHRLRTHKQKFSRNDFSAESMSHINTIANKLK